jgi:membrane protease subunit (stomatin/prohibitin family)
MRERLLKKVQERQQQQQQQAPAAAAAAAAAVPASGANTAVFTSGEKPIKTPRPPAAAPAEKQKSD